MAHSPHAVFYPDGSLAFDPTPKQLEFLESSAPWVLMHGNRGGGKSLVGRWRTHLMAMLHPGYDYLVVRNTLPELKRTHIKPLKAEMEKLGGSFNATDSIAKYPNGSTGIYIGVEDERGMQKLLSSEFDGIFFDEITLIPWETVVDIAACLRVAVDAPFIGQITAGTNPWGISADDVRRHWITKDITPDEEEDYDPDDYHAIEIMLGDNPHVDQKSYLKNLTKLQGQKRSAWLDGSWTPQGTFFSNFRHTREGQPWHVINELPKLNGISIYKHPAVPVYRSIDWGFADDPAVCLWIAILANSRAIVIKEMKWQRTAAAEVAHEIIGHSRDMKIVQTFCDPSMFNGQRHGAQSVGDIFEIEGVPLTPSVNNREVYSLHEYLSLELDDGLPKLQLWQEGCPELIRTLPQQKSNKLHPERLADSKTDHHALTIGYFCSGGVLGQQPATIKKVPRWMQPKNGDRIVLGSESVRHH